MKPMVNWYERDRAYGASLPVGVDMRRLAERLAPRVASVTTAMAQGFEPVAGASGIFRRAHALWAIRPAVDGQGCVIIRLRDEPAPGIEPRRAQQVTVQVSVDEPEPELPPEPELQMIELELVPETMMAPPELPVQAPAPAPEEPMIPMGEIHVADRRRAPSSFGHESDIGEVVEVPYPFRPLLYGNMLQIPQGASFTVVGTHPGTPQADRIADPNIMTPVYPDRPNEAARFVRIHLRHNRTGAELSVLPFEFENFLTSQRRHPKPPVEHRPKRSPHTREDSTVLDYPSVVNEDEFAEAETFPGVQFSVGPDPADSFTGRAPTRRRRAQAQTRCERRRA